MRLLPCCVCTLPMACRGAGQWPGASDPYHRWRSCRREGAAAGAAALWRRRYQRWWRPMQRAIEPWRRPTLEATAPACTAASLNGSCVAV